MAACTRTESANILMHVPFLFNQVTWDAYLGHLGSFILWSPNAAMFYALRFEKGGQWLADIIEKLQHGEWKKSGYLKDAQFGFDRCVYFSREKMVEIPYQYQPLIGVCADNRDLLGNLPAVCVSETLLKKMQMRFNLIQLHRSLIDDSRLVLCPVLDKTGLF